MRRTQWEARIFAVEAFGDGTEASVPDPENTAPGGENRLVVGHSGKRYVAATGATLIQQTGAKL